MSGRANLGKKKRKTTPVLQNWYFSIWVWELNGSFQLEESLAVVWMWVIAADQVVLGLSLDWEFTLCRDNEEFG